MPDQADILRHLVAGALRSNAPMSSESPTLIAIAGAKGGVGTTTIAVNLAVALSGQGQRVVLADVDFCRADVALHCGLNARYTTGDVLAGRREIHETLIAGPGGIQIAAGAWASPNSSEARPVAQQRLIDQLKRLGGHADYVLMDLGSDVGTAAQQYWQAADRVMLVTTPDAVAVMDAYAAMKIAGSACVEPRIQVVVNQLPEDQDGDDVIARIDRSCQRFLGFGIAAGGSVPQDRNVADALRQRLPLSANGFESPAALAIEAMADDLIQSNEPALQMA